MISRLHFSVVIFLVGIVWMVLLIIDGVAVKLSWLRYLFHATSAVFLLVGAFDMWLWRLPILRKWFVGLPDIRGTWQVVIQSAWRDPETNEVTDPIEGYMAVRQRLSSLSMRLMTNESSSGLITSKIARWPDKEFRIAAIYQNQPDILVQDRSRIHHGAFLLHVAGYPPSALNGEYWTDRTTIGQLRTTDHRRKIFHDFQAAKSAFSSEGTTEVSS